MLKIIKQMEENFDRLESSIQMKLVFSQNTTNLEFLWNMKFWCWEITNCIYSNHDNNRNQDSKVAHILTNLDIERIIHVYSNDTQVDGIAIYRRVWLL